jgi:hypothetical protein
LQCSVAVQCCRGLGWGGLTWFLILAASSAMAPLCTGDSASPLAFSGDLPPPLSRSASGFMSLAAVCFVACISSRRVASRSSITSIML